MKIGKYIESIVIKKHTGSNSPKINSPRKDSLSPISPEKVNSPVNPKKIGFPNP